MRTANTQNWIFDLDNTLYPPSTALFAQIDRRMREYIADFLGIDLDAAFRLQKSYFREYGMSLRGLMERHGMEPGPFLGYVHDIDLDPLAPMPALEDALGRLPGRKLVFTNAPAGHAERVLRRLGIEGHFCAIFDIAAAGYRPKPEPETYARLIERHDLDPRRSVMVEDMARNLVPAAALGMTTVWVRTDHDIASLGADGDHIHHVVDDLVAWLQDLADRIDPPAARSHGPAEPTEPR